MSYRRVALLVAFASVSLCLSPAHVWKVAGTWVYEFRAKAGSFSAYSNPTYSIETAKVLSDGSVVGRVTSKMVPFFKSVPLSSCVGRDGKPVDYAASSYYRDAAKREKFLAFARGVLGEKSTVDEVVVAVAHWMRSNVTYSLGTAADPLGVVASKRAYCEGYGNLMVEFLLAYGIDARSVSCYVPAGKGWGFSGSGGYHAFVEYWYPGHGGVMCDPQSTLNYVDPYHLLGFSRNQSDFISDWSDASSSAYVSGLTEGVVPWQTFSECDQAPEASVAEFLCRLPSGELLPGSVIDARAEGETAWLASELAKRRGPRSVFDFELSFYADQLRLKPGPNPRQYAKPDLPAAFPASARALCSAGSVVIESVVTLGGHGVSRSVVDVPSGARRVFFFGPDGFPDARVPVKAELDGKAVSLNADRSGSIIIAAPFSRLALEWRGTSLSLDANTAFPATFRAPRPPESPAAAPAKPDPKGTLTLVPVDPSGNANPAWFDSVDLYSTSGSKAAGKKGPDGSWKFPGAVAKAGSYVALGASGERHVRLALESPGGDVALELRDSGAPGTVISHEFPRQAKDEFLEPWEKAKIAYRGVAPRIVGVSGTLRLADSPDLKWLHEFDLSSSPDSVEFRRYAYSLPEFASVRLPAKPGESYLAGSVSVASRSYGPGITFLLDDGTVLAAETPRERVRKGTVWIVDPERGTETSAAIDESGFFLVPGLTPGERIIVFLDEGSVIAEKLDIVPGANVAELSDARPPVRLDSGGKDFYLAFPRRGKSLPDVAWRPLGGEGKRWYLRDFHASPGRWFVSRRKSLGSLLVLDVAREGAADAGGEGPRIRVPDPLARYPDDLVAALGLALAPYFGAGYVPLVARFVDQYGSALPSFPFSVSWGEKDRLSSATETTSIALLALPARDDLTLRAAAQGLLVSMPLGNPSSIPAPLVVPPDWGKVAVLRFNSEKQALILEPYRNAEGFAWRETRVDLKDSRLAVLSGDKALYLKAPGGSIVERAALVPGTTASVAFSKKTDQYSLKRDVLLDLWKGERLVAFRLLNGKSPLASQPFSLLDGGKSVRKSTDPDGLSSFLNPFPSGATLETKVDGLFARFLLSLPEGADPAELALDLSRRVTAGVWVNGLSKGAKASVTLHFQPVVEKGKIVKSTERISLSTDSSGQLLLALESGDYAAEYMGEARVISVKAGGKRVDVGFKARKK